MHIPIIQSLLQSDSAKGVQNNYDGRSHSPRSKAFCQYSSTLERYRQRRLIISIYARRCLIHCGWYCWIGPLVSVRLITTMTIVCYGHRILHVDGCTTPCVLIHHSAICPLLYINNKQRTEKRRKEKKSPEQAEPPHKHSLSNLIPLRKVFVSLFWRFDTFKHLSIPLISIFVVSLRLMDSYITYKNYNCTLP